MSSLGVRGGGVLYRLDRVEKTVEADFVALFVHRVRQPLGDRRGGDVLRVTRLRDGQFDLDLDLERDTVEAGGGRVRSSVCSGGATFASLSAFQHVAERRSGVPVRRRAGVAGRVLDEHGHPVCAGRDERRFHFLQHRECRLPHGRSWLLVGGVGHGESLRDAWFASWDRAGAGVVTAVAKFRGVTDREAALSCWED
jgi:hypothetical protein